MEPQEAAQTFLYQTLVAANVSSIVGERIHFDVIPQELENRPSTTPLDWLPATMIQYIDVEAHKWGEVDTGAWQFHYLVFHRVEDLNYPYTQQGEIKAALHKAGGSLEGFEIIVHEGKPHIRPFDYSGRQIRDAGGRYTVTVRREPSP